MCGKGICQAGNYKLVHNYQHVPDSGHIHLHVDAKVCGVGGDLPGIALLKEGYKIRKKEEQEQRFVLRRLS